MRKVLLFALLFISAVASAQTLRVGQYNIRNNKNNDWKVGDGWDTRAQKVYDLINYESWDVFGAQEVRHSQLEGLLANLDGYDYVGVGRNDGATKGEYAPIFYKKNNIRCLTKGHFWISETPDVVGSKGWDANQCRICTYGKFQHKATRSEFWVFNLHMDHKGVVARREGSKLVIAKIKEICGNQPFILTGDFNVDQKNEIYSILSSSGIMKDTFHEAKHRMAETGPMNYFKPEFNTDSRIDHIFVSNHFKVHNYGVLTYSYWTPIEITPEIQADLDAGKEGVVQHRSRMLSDHYPVAATIEIPRSRRNQDWSQYGRYAAENEKEKEVKVVFMGNSITQNWRKYRPQFFTNGYVCRGISGQVTTHMLARFRADVVNLKPETVVILAGTNDIAMNQGYISHEHILDNIISMTEIARYNKIKVVLCSVLPGEKYRWNPEMTSEECIAKIAQLNEMIKAYAMANGIPYADYYSVMVDDNKCLKKEYHEHGTDPIHPNEQGYVVMEEVIQKILNKKRKH